MTQYLTSESNLGYMKVAGRKDCPRKCFTLGEKIGAKFEAKNQVPDK
jgi:hypothetical protein